MSSTKAKQQLPTKEKHIFTKAHIGPIHVARWNTFGRYILTGGQDRQIKLWNGKTGPTSTSASSPNSTKGAEAIKTYSGHSHDVHALDITPDNARFASGGNDKSVFVWDVSTGSILRRFNVHHGKINEVRFASTPQHQDGEVLFAAGFDATVRAYDLRAAGAWKPIAEMKDAKDSIMALDITDHLVCAGSVDGVVRTYDLRMGEMRADVLDHPITSLQVSGDQQSYLVSTLDSTHRLLDMIDGTLLQSFTGHTNSAYRCHSAFAQSEAYIIAGDEQGYVHAWDILSGAKSLFAPSTAPTPSAGRSNKAVMWVEESPARGDHDVLSAGADGTLRVWSNRVDDY